MIRRSGPERGLACEQGLKGQRRRLSATGIDPTCRGLRGLSDSWLSSSFIRERNHFLKSFSNSEHRSNPRTQRSDGHIVGSTHSGLNERSRCYSSSLDSERQVFVLAVIDTYTSGFDRNTTYALRPTF